MRSLLNLVGLIQSHLFVAVTFHLNIEGCPSECRSSARGACKHNCIRSNGSTRRRGLENCKAGSPLMARHGRTSSANVRSLG
jgi:hypothetical protein